MSVIDDIESGKLTIEITQSVCKFDDVIGLVKVQDKAKAELLRLAKEATETERLRPAADWGEDYGDVLWWTVPISEPPYVGSPLDCDWVDGIYTHWTPIIVPKEDQP